MNSVALAPKPNLFRFTNSWGATRTMVAKVQNQRQIRILQDVLALFTPSPDHQPRPAPTWDQIDLARGIGSCRFGLN